MLVYTLGWVQLKLPGKCGRKRVECEQRSVLAETTRVDVSVFGCRFPVALESMSDGTGHSIARRDIITKLNHASASRAVPSCGMDPSRGHRSGSVESIQNARFHTKCHAKCCNRSDCNYIARHPAGPVQINVKGHSNMRLGHFYYNMVFMKI